MEWFYQFLIGTQKRLKKVEMTKSMKIIKILLKKLWTQKLSCWWRCSLFFENSFERILNCQSDLYDGPASDKQLVKWSWLQKKCEPGDVVTPDKRLLCSLWHSRSYFTATKCRGYLPLQKKKEKQKARKIENARR